MSDINLPLQEDCAERVQSYTHGSTEVHSPTHTANLQASQFSVQEHSTLSTNDEEFHQAAAAMIYGAACGVIDR